MKSKGLLLLFLLPQTSLAVEDSAAWRKIEWTEEYCIPASGDYPTASKIGNPFNSKKLGSESAMRLADLMCALGTKTDQEFASEKNKALAELFSYPDPLILAALKTSMKGDRENWSDAFEMALKLAAGCDKVAKVRKYRYECRRSLSEKAASNLANFLENQLGFPPVQRAQANYTKRQMEGTLTEFIASLYERVLKRHEYKLREELETLALSLPVEIRGDWLRQFFSPCENGSRSETASLFEVQADTPIRLPLLFHLSAKYKSPESVWSPFLHSVRTIAAGKIMKECLKKQ
ncbi:MAG: hypothetical protein K2X47_05110 [Bdellovibrionales bacterium]|nr:hypothetical protein [Bdellovibrionales bacterium]